MAFELPKFTERSSSPTLRELTEAVQRKIDLYRPANEDCPRSPTMAAVPEPAHYTSRTLSEPVAAVEVCPAHPDYMVIGTYALLKSDEPEASIGQIRTGSISVLPLAASFKPAYPGAALPSLDQKRLNAAVLDIHFHPSDKTLLGVATSDAKMTFFRLNKRADVLARRVGMQLLYLGSIDVAKSNEHREIPLITSFCWLPGSSTGRIMPEGHDYHTVSFIASISNGGVKWIRATMPATLAAESDRFNSEAAVVAFVAFERHTEEAWTVAATAISNTSTSTSTSISSGGDDTEKILILSGGDDSALIASSATPKSTSHGIVLADIATRMTSSQDLCTPSLLNSPPHHLWTDRKSHTAGVVAILPLCPPPHPTHTSIPILTGSYDEHIRLFVLDTTSPILKRSLIFEEKLGGGVWRLKLMHESTTPSTSTPDNRYSALILASCMHGGVCILRLTYDPPAPNTNTTTTNTAVASSSSPLFAERHGWHMKILGKFTKGHESMNYGSDFRVERDEDGQRTGEYTIVSTSFYDQVVCVWKFVDEDEQQRERTEKGK